jgi:hypothetical protein
MPIIPLIIIASLCLQFAFVIYFVREQLRAHVKRVDPDLAVRSGGPDDGDH